MSFFAHYSKKIRFLLTYMHLSVLRNVEYSQQHIVALGTAGFICFPLFYLIWKFIFPQPYENLTLRLIGSAFCLPIIFKDYWPRRFYRFFHWYCYVTVLYALPFFLGFMVLKNDWSSISIMSLLVGVFLLILLVDWLSLTILFILGITLAWIAAFISDPSHVPPVHMEYLIVYIFAIVVGSVFNYKAALVAREKLTAMSLISGSIAHELRTPLLGIKSGSIGIKRYLPLLFEAYNLAKDSGLPVTKIRSAHWNTLLPALERIESETNNANTVIDMLLMNVGKQAIDPSMFELCSMSDCINEALHRFPFSSKEESEKIIWQSTHDFQFWGAKLLMVHVLFNLIKNALHSIAQARKGQIRIWLAESEKYNYLYFKDTGRGIPPEILPRIFERFFSTTISGTGIGLSFCQIVVESFGGIISCRSEFGAYSEFILSFPKEKSNL